MNAPEADSPLPLAKTPATADTDQGSDGTSEKPKRRRAPRKTAVEADAPTPPDPSSFAAPSAADIFGKSSVDVAPAPAADASAALETGGPAPARKRTRRAAVDAQPAVQSADAADVAGQAAHDVGDGNGNGGSSTGSTSTSTSTSDGISGNANDGGSAGNHPAGNGGDDSSNGDNGNAGDGKTASARRNRNRRRGRRGGERGRDGAADGNAEAGADGAPPQAATAPPAPLAAVAQELFAQVLSGEFDADPEQARQAGAVASGAPDAAPTFDGMSDTVDALAAPGADAAPQTAVGLDNPDNADLPKRVLAAEPDAPKLHKVLAQAGVGSRRDLEQMITDNRVTVNGEVAHTGQRISFGDRIQIDGKPVRFRIAPPPARVLAYHKPAGEVVSHDDPQQRPTVFRRLPRLQHGKWQSVGRLDINTEGLLLFTTSGELANQLMHPRFGVEREYAVRSLGVLGQDAKAKLLEGVDIDGQRCGFKSIEDGGGEGVNHWYRCVITEGRNREVRRLFETVGHAVSRLIRIRYGSVVLPRGLKRGVWVDLDEHDLRNLRRLASVPRQEGQGERPAHGVQNGPQNGPQGAPRDGQNDRDGDGRRGRNRRSGKRRNDEPSGLPQDQSAPAARGQQMDGSTAGVERQPRADRPPRPERGSRAERPNRAERPDRPDRPDRPPRAERPDGGNDRADGGDSGFIPNPLQQTFDKRAIQQERALRRDMPEDGPIPNPLQQTYDKRALQRDRAVQRDIPEDGPIPNPLQQTYDKRFAQGGGQARGAGAGGNAQRRKRPGGPPGPGGQKKGGPAGDPNRVPDPLQTSVGFIGANAFHNKAAGGRGGQRRSAGGGGGGGGGGNGSGPTGGNRNGPRGGRGGTGGGTGGGNRGGNRGGGGNRGPR